MSFSLHKLESSLPEDIIRKGLDYFAASRVKNMRLEDNRWTAEVEGTMVYRVDLTITKDDQVENWSCDCPYRFGPVCKHVAAVCFAVRSDRQEEELKKMLRFRKRKG